MNEGRKSQIILLDERRLDLLIQVNALPFETRKFSCEMFQKLDELRLNSFRTAEEHRSFVSVYSHGPRRSRGRLRQHPSIVDRCHATRETSVVLSRKM